MRRVVCAVAVLIALIGASATITAAQQIDPARLQATIARLNLTEAQKTDARPIVEAGIRERLQILQEAGFERGQKPSLRQLLMVRGPIRKSQARTEAQLSDILSPDQMEEYRKIVEESREQMRARF
ncbi:MAG: hypothetical protein ACR2RE_05610 [Geminicoccaceae bacterium]